MNLLKQVVRPIWRPVKARIVAGVEAQVRELERRLNNLQHEFVKSQDKLAALQGELSSVQAELGRSLESVTSHSQSITSLWERLEFVRREMLFEMKYGTANSSGRAETAPRTIAHEKVQAAIHSGARVNLGCGHIPLDGFVNVDQRELPGVDIVADIGDLPFESNSVREIFSAHLLEHFPQEDLRRRLLPYWRTLLVDGGTFRAIVPDGAAMLEGIRAGNYPFDDFREVLFGGQDYEGDFHFNMFTPESLAELLGSTGFQNVRVVEQGRRNGRCFEFEIVATKRSTAQAIAM